MMSIFFFFKEGSFINKTISAELSGRHMVKIEGKLGITTKMIKEGYVPEKVPIKIFSGTDLSIEYLYIICSIVYIGLSIDLCIVGLFMDKIKTQV